MCVWFIPSSYLYKEQIYWGMGYRRDTQPLGLPYQHGTIHVISRESESSSGHDISRPPSTLHLH